MCIRERDREEEEEEEDREREGVHRNVVNIRCFL